MTTAPPRPPATGEALRTAGSGVVIPDVGPAHVTDRPRRRSWAALAAAVASGLAQYAAFPPLGWWPLAPVGVALLFLAVRGRRLRTAYGLAAVSGLAFLLPLLSWTRVTGADGWLILTLAETAIVALKGPALVLVGRLRFWPLLVPCVVVAEEALRGRFPFGGFPWGRLGFTAPAGLDHLAAYGGAPLVTAGLALAGGLLAYAVVARDRRVPAAGALVATVALPLLAGLLPLPAAHGRQIVVAIVQGNVPRLGLDAETQRQVVLANHLAATRQLAADVAAGRQPRPDLVVWPENASDLDPFENATAARMLTQAARAVGQPILVGAVLQGPGPRHVRNAGLVWTPQGVATGIYVKRHPVPFAEYLPYRSVLEKLVTRFQTLLPKDFVPGRTPGVLDVGDVRIADVICFEIGDDRVVRQAVAGGGGVLVVQTNNATFGRSAESAQQLAMARLRAVEHGRPTLVSSTSGISAVIGPDGTVEQQSQIFTRDVLVHRIALSDARTVADRVGAAPEWALTALGVAGIGAGALALRRSRKLQA